MRAWGSREAGAGWEGRAGGDGVEGNMGEGTGFREAGAGWGGGGRVGMGLRGTWGGDRDSEESGWGGSIGDGGNWEEGDTKACQHEVPQDRLF